MALKVLVVCTGNICRSPMAERLLASRLGGLVEVSSAGTQALVGQPMTPESAAITRRWKAEPAGHAARQLDEEALAGVDLVLTAEREHRTAVLRLAPSLVRRTFTLREAGRLAARLAPELRGTTPQARLEELRDGLAAARGRWQDADPADDDVEDPYGASDVTYARSAGTVHHAVQGLVAAVRPDRQG